MASKNTNHTPTLWEQLPPEQRQRIQKELAVLNKLEPSQKSKSRNGQFQLKGYVRCELSVADKDAFRVWETEHSPEEALARLVKIVDSGYLFKVGENGASYQASICAASTGQPWDGYVLTAHAGSGARAAQLLVYKHEVLMSATWTEWLTDEGEDALR